MHDVLETCFSLFDKRNAEKCSHHDGLFHLINSYHTLWLGKRQYLSFSD